MGFSGESPEAGGSGQQSPDASADRTQVKESANVSDGPGRKRQSRRQRQRSEGNGEAEDRERGEDRNGAVNGAEKEEEVKARQDAGETPSIVDSNREGRSSRRKKKTASVDVGGGAGEGGGHNGEGDPVGIEEKKA